jgi:hypothetical protein
LSFGASGWQEFQDFYDDEKRSILAQSLALLRPYDKIGLSKTQLKSVENRLAFVRAIRFITNRWKTSFSISVYYLSFIRSALNRFWEVMHRPVIPSREEIIDVRMELWACQWLLDPHLASMKETAKARKVEHFGQSDYLQFIPISDLAKYSDRRSRKCA